MFSSLTKAFDQNEIVYVLKYLFTYEQDSFDQLFDEFDDFSELIPLHERQEIVEALTQLKFRLKDATINEKENGIFELIIDEQRFYLTLIKGSWRISPYSYKIVE